MIGGGEQAELLHTPTLAKLVREMNQRPVWLVVDKAPLPVDAETFERARSEMKDALERQGRTIAEADWAPKPNFLLRGIPVVMNG